jgi:hypothetical protein
MMNEKEYAVLINKVTNIYADSTNASNTDKKLARHILKEYYSCETFFLNREADLSSGINLPAVRIFVDNMKSVIAAINGEGN